MIERLTIEQHLSQWTRQAFSSAFPEADLNDINLNAVPTADETFGDFQCNAAMALAKALKRKPREIAQTVVSRTTLPESIDKVEVAGPGFLNIFMKSSWLAAQLDAVQKDDRLGVPKTGEAKTFVMDYGSPNITKPLHIGHLRSHNIGSALDRLHRFLGYKVIADNHLGDWGTQFGITIMGYRHFGNPDAMEKAPLEELERVYIQSYEKTKTDEAWLEQCRRELVKLQSGDPENRALWEKFVRLSIQELDQIYKRLDISYDLVRGESYYHDKLEAVVKFLESEGIARQSEGATVVMLDDEKLPVCIVRKSDGGFNYATTDLATAMSRTREFHPDAIVYVTDERQQLHFKQVFAICRKIKIQTRLIHIWFGLMRLPEGTFSTREGNVIKLSALLDLAESKALQIVQQTSPTMDPQQQKDVARAVGIGAVKYIDLSQNPQSLVTFTWDKALALDGNSAPYLQYAYARIASVQDKYSERFPGKNPNDCSIVLNDPLERKLAIRLVRFPDVVIAAAENFKPNLLADYLYELAQVYSTFYQNIPFLKADQGVRESRVRLCDIVAKTLRNGLHLLGIETPSRI